MCLLVALVAAGLAVRRRRSAHRSGRNAWDFGYERELVDGPYRAVSARDVDDGKSAQRVAAARSARAHKILYKQLEKELQKTIRDLTT